MVLKFGPNCPVLLGGAKWVFFFFFKLRKVVDNLCNIIKMVSTWKIKNAIFNYACLYFVIFY